ncbi:hypothetical protein BGW38_002691 [Lunasporangiospora selenospora]|uniref:Uncharacterized protein n=1 Tax=Lunasporangiospora selenospora TaxID=979761 RepID=A0A9P6FS01_9FUNG|nr:hypothetical protein BGW38_002691 [Lunasporangiospora selenospora]
MDPHFRDLMALRSDYSALFTQLKLTQQTLQYSYQDLVMAQERDKRSEVETTRLRAQMDVLLKKHVDHHPEQEALVRELGELQSNFDIEVTSRKRLEQDHAALQQEILRQRCSQSISNTALNSGPRHISIPTHSSSFVNSNPSASSSSAVSPSSPSTSTFASVTGSIRASSFASFLTGAALGGSRRGRASISNSDREPDNNLTKAEKEDATPVPDRSTPERDQLQGNVNITDDMTSVTLVGQEYEELSTVSSLLPSWEQIEAEKQVYENLREENVSLTMELKDLHHRLKAERDSIKSYMSLFESLQKKQANALAVAQSEIGLLRASAQDTQTRLASRQALIDTFAAAVNNQAADLETLTKELARERVSRAQVEQEMAGLLEASLVMIERWFTQLEQSRRHLAQVMLDPMRQAIERLEAPNLLQEWEQYELEVQNVFRELAEKLVRQQSAQDQELVTGVSVLVDTPKSNVKHGGGGFDMFKQLFLGQNDQPQKTSITTTAVTSTATVTIPSIDSTAMSAVEKGRNSENTISGDDLVLDNSKSQDVFLWRKFKADSFLEECVKSVEQLAKEKKELQTRIVELTKLLASHEEQSTVKSLAQQQQAVNPEAEDDLQESKDNEEEHGQSDSTQLQVAQTNDEPAVSESSMLQSPNPDDCGSDDKHPLSAAGQPIETPNDSVQDEKNLVSDKGQPTEVLSDGGSGDKDSLLDEGVLAEEIIKPTPVSDNGLLTDSGESCPPPGDSDRKISCQPTAMPSNANETGLVERAERLETALVRILVLANQQKRCTDTQSKPGNSTEDVVHSLGISDEAFEYEMLEQPAKADNDSVWQQSFSGHSAASSPLATDWHQLAQAIHQEYIVPLKRSCAGTTLTQLDIVLTSDHATLSEESTERAVRAGQAMRVKSHMHQPSIWAWIQSHTDQTH